MLKSIPVTPLPELGMEHFWKSELWDKAMSAMLEAAAVARTSGVDLGDVDLQGT